MIHAPEKTASSSPAPKTDDLREALTHWFGHPDFRAGQREIVETVLNGMDTLAILPTGGGKSLTYQLPALLLPGATLVLSPLIALMKDQTENLPPAVAERTTVINSSLDFAEIGRRLERVRRGEIKIVYAAPERLRQETFLHALRRAGLEMVVVDEAHCISQWGHDFRPDYRAVGKAVARLNPRRVLAVTATATPEIADDIERQLGRSMRKLVRATYRDNLYLACRKCTGEDEKLQVTLDLCQNLEGAGLVYAGSRERCERLARMLKRQGISAGFYHAGLPPEERALAQDRFMRGEVRVMAATVAFGMGVDKSNIRFIVHYHPSRTLENYYQEAGRAGRDGEVSQCILLYSSADAGSATRHHREDVLTLEGIRNVYRALQAALPKNTQGGRSGPVQGDALIQNLGGDEGTVRATLPLLEEAELVVRHGDVPRRIGVYPKWENHTEEFTLDLADVPPPPVPTPKRHPVSLGEGEEEQNQSATSDVTNDTLPLSLRWERGQGGEVWSLFAPHVEDGGDFSPQYLSEASGVPLYELEETLLRLQDQGFCSVSTGPRDWLIEMLPAPSDTRKRMEDMLAHRLRGEEERMEAMLNYARDNKCRHQTIARYFGDRWSHHTCGRCDICTGENLKQRLGIGQEPMPTAAPTDEEIKSAPLWALQVVYDLGRTSFAVGRAALARILRGSPDAPVKQNRTRPFGKLANWKKVDVERLCDALVEQEYLRRDDEDEYRRLYLTPEGVEALQAGELDITWKMSVVRQPRENSSRSRARTSSGSAASPVAAPIQASDADPALLDALKTWRREIASADNVPPYVVFPDKTLIALAASPPTNEFDLLEIPGIGPSKAAKYGTQVLELVRKAGHGQPRF